MDFPEIINAILSILSFLLALISIVFVYLSIQQNNKLLSDNIRPYLSVYFVYEENNSEVFCCIRNEGKSSAIIEEMSVAPELRIFDLLIEDIVKNLLLAPNQQVHFLIEDNESLMEGEKKFNVAIKYRTATDDKKRFSENYTLDIRYMLHVLSVEHEKTRLSKAENAVVNLEKDVKAIMLKQL